MTVILIVLLSLLYVAIGALVAALLYKLMPWLEEGDAFFFGLFWPIGVPFGIVSVLFRGLFDFFCGIFNS